MTEATATGVPPGSPRTEPSEPRGRRGPRGSRLPAERGDRPRGPVSRVLAAAALPLAASAVASAALSSPAFPAVAPPAAAQTPPDTAFRDCPHCPKIVVVPAGTFLMGSPPSGDWRFEDEEPQHPVTIGAAFAIGVHEVTFEQWDACVSGGGCGGYRPADEGWGRGRRPVTNVSWEDARNYVQWLSEETGETYRLPSEARWEYAARAGTKTARYWGDGAAEQCRYANGLDADLAEVDPELVEGMRALGAGPAPCSDGQAWGTAPVGSYEPNAFGLYDMIGNLAEWTDDCEQRDYSEGEAGDGAWSSGDCSARMLRGGTWSYPVESLRSAYRLSLQLDRRDNGIGFRVVRDIR